MESDIVSDIPGRATFTDPNLVNPWGIAFSPTSPLWISDNGTGLSTLYSNSTGATQSLVVNVPNPAGGNAAPTGIVFNAGTAFNSDRFIFATENGTVSGWKTGTTATDLLINHSGDSVYKGLAIGSISTNSYLYAADFHNDRIDVLGSTGAPALSGSFADASIPVGYAPFNIQNLGGQLFVTYAKQDADAHDDVAGPGNGYIAVFDLNGNLLRNFAAGGPLDSPWGLAIAPSGFGSFGGDLLVGNFGDGRINVFDTTTGGFLDSLRDSVGNPIDIEGLWGLAFGTGANANSLWFTAGISGGGDIEDHGLLGRITAVPEPGTGTAGAALAGLCGLVWLRRRAKKA